MLDKGVEQLAMNVVPVATLVANRELAVLRLPLRLVRGLVPANCLKPLETVNWCRRKNPHVILEAKPVAKDPID